MPAVRRGVAPSVVGDMNAIGARGGTESPAPVARGVDEHDTTPGPRAATDSGPFLAERVRQAACGVGLDSVHQGGPLVGEMKVGRAAIVLRDVDLRCCDREQFVECPDLALQVGFAEDRPETAGPAGKVCRVSLGDEVSRPVTVGIENSAYGRG